MARAEELSSEEQTEEQRTAHMESILQKIERSLRSEFAPAQYGNGGEQQVRFIIEGKRATLFIFPRLEDGMKADVRLLVQGRGGEVFISQIPDALIHEEEDGITFSGEDGNGTGLSLSIKEDGEIVGSPGSASSQG